MAVAQKLSRYLRGAAVAVLLPYLLPSLTASKQFPWKSQTQEIFCLKTSVNYLLASSLALYLHGPEKEIIFFKTVKMNKHQAGNGMETTRGLSWRGTDGWE